MGISMLLGAAGGGVFEDAGRKAAGAEVSTPASTSSGSGDGGGGTGTDGALPMVGAVDTEGFPMGGSSNIDK